MRALSGLATAAVLAAGLLAAQPAAAQQDLKVGAFGTDATRLDPHVSSTGADVYLFSFIYNALVRFRPGSMDPATLEPDLAERWEVTPDGLTWTFHLRKGVQFHGGYGELTAEDVVYSLERAADPKRSSSAASFSAMKSVEAVDPHTVRVTLKTPVPLLLGTLSNYRGGMIVSKKATVELGDNMHTRPIGTGPFQFVEYRPKQFVLLTAFPQHFRGKPQVEKVTYRYIDSDNSRELAFRNKEIDLFYGRREQDWVERMKKDPEIAIDIFEPAQSRLLHINRTKKPFDDPRVRRAVLHAIDRNEFLDLVGRDITRPLFAPVPIGFAGQHKELKKYTYDPAKAKALLAEAGFPNGFSVKTQISKISSLNVPMTLIQEQLRRVGINVELEVLDHSAWHAAIRRNESPLVIYGAAQFPIADDFLTPIFHSNARMGGPNPALNFSHCDVADKEIDTARAEVDEGKRNALYHAAQEKILDDGCAVPIFELMQVYGRRKTFDLGYTLQGDLNLGPPITPQARFR